VYIVTWLVNTMHLDINSGELIFEKKHETFVSLTVAKKFAQALRAETNAIDALDVQIFKCQPIAINGS